MISNRYTFYRGKVNAFKEKRRKGKTGCVLTCFALTVHFDILPIPPITEIFHKVTVFSRRALLFPLFFIPSLWNFDGKGKLYKINVKNNRYLPFIGRL